MQNAIRPVIADVRTLERLSPENAVATLDLLMKVPSTPTARENELLCDYYIASFAAIGAARAGRRRKGALVFRDQIAVGLPLEAKKSVLGRAARARREPAQFGMLPQSVLAGSLAALRRT